MANILITGSNRGIGRELAERLSARGDNVLACARKDAPDGPNLSPITLDVTDQQSLAGLAQRLKDHSLDLLVCNAGVLHGRGGIDDPVYTAETFAESFAVNVTGVFLTIRACLPAIRRAGGHIAVITSQMGSTERAKGGAYSYRASKAAATNLAISLSKELAAEGIAVSAFHPGWVRTDMGGGDADVSVEDSAAGLIARFDELSMANTGSFTFYSGEAIPF
ncbi:MAG: SDR family oxidoreductase [Pseudomonadota bacterium]